MADRNPLPPVVLEALRRGDKVVAIKLLREMMKLGLAEAKGVIDALEAQERAKGTAKPPPSNIHGGMQHAHPTAHRRPREDDLGPGEVPRSSPFAGVVIMIVVAAIVLGVWLYSKAG